MKKTLTFAALLSASLSFGQQFSLLPAPNNSIAMGHELVEVDAEYSVINGQSYQDFTKSHAVTSMDAGTPALPYFSESVIVPNQGSLSLVVNHEGYTEYQNVEVAPSKGNLKRNVNPAQVPHTFGTAYTTDAFFPGTLARLGTAYNFRQTRGVTVSVSPYQYNPVTKTLRVYHNIQATVVVNESQEGVNELHHVPQQRDVMSQLYFDHYLNAELVMGRYTPLEEEGELLIIAGDNYMDEVQPLVNWKIREGIKTTMVGTSTAGSTDTQIKSYIENYYTNNPNLVYVLLVGDHNAVPSHSYGNSGWGEQLWSDSYFAMLTGNDYYPEIFIGRFSGNANQITTQVERTLEYEQNPAAGEWMSRAIGLASDEGAGYGDDNEADWQHNRNMRDELLNYGYTQVYEFYDGSHGGDDAPGNPGPGDVSPAVNDGVGLFNYTGHGDQNTCVTGNFGSNHINAATNNGFYPFVISVACNNGTFTSGTCISEDWVWATNNGTPTGAIAACGSTILMAWAEPMQTQDEMTEIIAENYANNRKVTLGGIFYNAQMSMLEDYNNSATAVEVMQTWVMFGDPSCMFRNQASMDMEVTHWWNVPMTTTDIDVTCNIEGAKIAIVQEGEILGTGIVSGGTVNINIGSLTSNQPLYVTGTKQNYIPYQGYITVEGGPTSIAENNGLESITVFPNPAADHVNVQWKGTAPTTIEVLDLSGKVILQKAVNAEQTSTLTISTNELAAGVYMMRFSNDAATSVTKLVVR